jgi:hypothetical protein
LKIHPSKHAPSLECFAILFLIIEFEIVIDLPLQEKAAPCDVELKF